MTIADEMRITNKEELQKNWIYCRKFFSIEKYNSLVQK